VNDSHEIISYGGGLSSRPTKSRYCRYLASKGRCQGKHFLAICICGAHGATRRIRL